MEVGQSVFADFGRYSSIDVRQGKVERITPSGQVVINFNGHTYKFRNGREISSDAWYKARILDEKTAQDLLEIQAERRLRQKIRGALDEIKASKPKAELLVALANITAMAESLPDDR